MTKVLSKHGTSWSDGDQQLLKVISKNWTSHQQLYGISGLMSKLLERTESAVCNKVESIKDWHWTKGANEQNHPERRTATDQAWLDQFTVPDNADPKRPWSEEEERFLQEIGFGLDCNADRDFVAQRLSSLLGRAVEDVTKRLSEPGTSIGIGYEGLKEAIDALDARISGEVKPADYYPPCIDQLKLGGKWLHFGLNGSDYDTASGRPQYDTFMRSVAHIDGLKPDEVKKLKKDGLVYEPYFSRPVSLYASHGYYPLWQHPEFFKIETHRAQVLKEMGLEKVTTDYQEPAGNHVIFTDMLFVRNKDASQIVPYLKDKRTADGESISISDQIWELWKRQVEYYKPTGITIANGSASTLIRQRMGIDRDITRTEYKGIPVILTTQFSGGAMSNPKYEAVRDEFGRIVGRVVSK